MTLRIILVIMSMIIAYYAITDRDGGRFKKQLRLMVAVTIFVIAVNQSFNYSIKIEKAISTDAQQQKAISDIPDLSSITNGLYSSIGSYNDGGGKWIAIIHPTIVTDIDSGNRVVRTVNIGELPILVRLEHNITNPRNGDTNKFIGLVEVGTNANGKFIRDYKPTFK